jgi:uridine phosphorylase
MPVHLRPTAPTADSAILVGDPGRALLLAQALLEQPKMSNHARGLWGYYGETAGGRALTIQSTGIGGPSAALVLADLAELGVGRAIRVGTCVGLNPEAKPGRLLIVGEAIAAGGSAAALGVGANAKLRPDRSLSERLLAALGNDCLTGAALSVDAHPGEVPPREDAIAADMQTAPLLAQSARLGVEVAAVLIVAEARRRSSTEVLAKEALEEAERRAGKGALSALSA